MRCIKPNGLQVAATFDAPLTLHQLRCCGVLEVTRIARAGYPTRYLHQNFAERYHVLLHGAGAGVHPFATAPPPTCWLEADHIVQCGCYATCDRMVTPLRTMSVGIVCCLSVRLIH